VARELRQEEDFDKKVLDITNQLARLHALMVYQVICLFDGEIRSRHVAESRLFVLSSWATQLVELASHVFAELFANPDPLEEVLLKLSGVPVAASCLEKRWQAWILAESVRRTWLVAMAIYSVYFMMHQDWVLCPGGVMFTNGQGIWDAKSASGWEKLWSKGNANFIQRFEAERLFIETRPADIDEFGKFMLEITFGSDKMKQWA
jgi:hypothetical protein